MPNIRDVIGSFALTVVEADFAVDCGRVDQYVHVLVNAHREDETAILTIVRWQIRPSTAECNAKWRAGQNHLSSTTPSWISSSARRYACGVSIPKQYPSITCPRI